MLSLITEKYTGLRCEADAQSPVARYFLLEFVLIGGRGYGSVLSFFSG